MENKSKSQQDKKSSGPSPRETSEDELAQEFSLEETGLPQIKKGLAEEGGRKGAARVRLKPQDAIRLQRHLGNQQARSILAPGAGRTLQRTQITVPAERETLHNRVSSTTDQFTARTYRVGTRGVNNELRPIRYEMVRSGSQVNVNVRIKFVALFGTDTTEPSAIPEGQPQDVARDMCTQLLEFWNTSNQFELVGTRQPTWYNRLGFGEGSSEPTEVRLPVRFNITPVFDLAEDAHATVQLDTVNPGNARAGRVVNASHWYSTLDPNSYAGGIGDTYAHEFGHLLGIPDEYSLSNPAAHDLMHQISPNPTTQATMDEALDSAGVREMILAAITPAIQSRLRSQASDLSAVLEGQQDQMIQLVAARLREAWGDAAVQTEVGDQIRAQLDAAGQSRASARVSDVLNFETGANLSNLNIARQIIPSEIGARRLGLLLSSVTSQAAEAAQQGTVDVSYLNESGASTTMEVGVDVAPAVSTAASPLAVSAGQAAEAAVGTPSPSAPGGAVLYPSDTLMGQLTALPASWTDLAARMEPNLALMTGAISDAVRSHLSRLDVSGNVNDSVRQLYQELYELVTAVSRTAVRTTIREFLFDEIFPIIDHQITDIMQKVDEETARHTTATSGGTNAGTIGPVPAIDAAVQQMQQTARSMLNPAAPAGGGPADQNVRFSTHTMMGRNSRGTSLRADQLTGLAEQFNSHQPDLRRANEDPFEVRQTT